ncbi:hypothetical protein EHM76_01335, partial [bacterium]
MATGPSSHTSMLVPLLATRFFSPPLPAACVSRPRLLEQMKKAMQRPVTLVSAPPGFGKSSLVSEWIHHRADIKTAWLSLETSDRDWGVFFRYLVAAWQHIYPEAGETALAELESSVTPNKEALLNYLLNDLLAGQDAVRPEHSLLILDDYHRIEISAIHESMTYLVEHLPPYCHLALLTRSDPPMPVARWRSQGQLLEIRTDDLRFTPLEAANFLNQSMGLARSGDQISILEGRTEGWIAGLQMAALSLQACRDTQEFVDEFCGCQRYILDYLIDEVVNQQAQDIQEFLLATALFDKFSASLCDHLMNTASPYSQHILERLEKANLFLIPLDDRRHWFRYHQLFADLLRARLQQTNAAHIPILYHRAAVWFAENDLWREAIQIAFRIPDFELGADLYEQAILKNGREFLFGGISALIEPFPLALLQTHPLLSLAKAISLIERARVDGIEAFLSFAEQAIEKLSVSNEQNELLGSMAIVQGWVATLVGDNAKIIATSQSVRRWLPYDTRANAAALANLGNAYFFEGDLNQTDACWQQVLDLRLANGDLYQALEIMYSLGRICCHKGELHRAEQLFQHALALSARQQDRYPRLLGATQRDYSDLLRERNSLEAAQTLMTSGLALIERWEHISGQALGYLHAGRIRLAYGDQPGAEAMLQKAESLHQAHPFYPDLETLLQVFRAELWLVAGEIDRAWQTLESCLASPCCRHALHQEWTLIAQAWFLICT